MKYPKCPECGKEMKTISSGNHDRGTWVKRTRRRARKSGKIGAKVGQGARVVHYTKIKRPSCFRVVRRCGNGQCGAVREYVGRSRADVHRRLRRAYRRGTTEYPVPGALRFDVG